MRVGAAMVLTWLDGPAGDDENGAGQKFLPGELGIAREDFRREPVAALLKGRLGFFPSLDAEVSFNDGAQFAEADAILGAGDPGVLSRMKADVGPIDDFGLPGAAVDLGGDAGVSMVAVPAVEIGVAADEDAAGPQEAGELIEFGLNVHEMFGDVVHDEDVEAAWPARSKVAGEGSLVAERRVAAHETAQGKVGGNLPAPGGAAVLEEVAVEIEGGFDAGVGPGAGGEEADALQVAPAADVEDGGFAQPRADALGPGSVAATGGAPKVAEGERAAPVATAQVGGEPADDGWKDGADEGLKTHAGGWGSTGSGVPYLRPTSRFSTKMKRPPRLKFSLKDSEPAPRASSRRVP
jgi:hypothetical protein